MTRHDSGCNRCLRRSLLIKQRIGIDDQSEFLSLGAERVRLEFPVLP